MGRLCVHTEPDRTTILTSKLGLPVSTTHVSCGALFGIGTVTRRPLEHHRGYSLGPDHNLTAIREPASRYFYTFSCVASRPPCLSSHGHSRRGAVLESRGLGCRIAGRHGTLFGQKIGQSRPGLKFDLGPRGLFAIIRLCTPLCSLGGAAEAGGASSPAWRPTPLVQRGHQWRAARCIQILDRS